MTTSSRVQMTKFSPSKTSSIVFIGVFETIVRNVRSYTWSDRHQPEDNSAWNYYSTCLLTKLGVSSQKNALRHQPRVHKHNEYGCTRVVEHAGAFKCSEFGVTKCYH